jgi:hypothetical protein
MSKSKKIKIDYIFDSGQIKAAWNQLMKENREGMQLGLQNILQQAQVPSDPAIYVKDDEVIFKTINTDKGLVFAYKDNKKDQLVSKPYKLIANDEPYVVLNSAQGKFVFYFKRGGEADQMVGAFDSVDMAVEGLKKVEDPRVMEQRIREQDIKQGLIDQDGNPIEGGKEKAKKAIDEAIKKSK